MRNVNRQSILWLTVAFFWGTSCIAGQAFAASKTNQPEVQVSTVCIEAETGLVLSESNADIRRPPASMVKMMQMLLVAEGLHEGAWTLDKQINVSRHAEHMGGTQVYLAAGETWTLGQLMEAVSVASANDAAMAIAEGLWGSEEAYKLRANERAAELGMTNTVFNSVHGLPPSPGEEPDHTTARDMALLGRICVQDPLILKWTSQRELQFRPNESIKHSTNKLLWQMDGCDGIKTGYIRDAGFCITASACRDDVRLIAVVMGDKRKQERFSSAKRLLEEGFAQVCRKELVAAGQAVGDPVAVANCETTSIKLAATEPISIIVKRNEADKITLVPELPTEITAPLQAGTEVGMIRALLEGRVLAAVPLAVQEDLAEASLSWKVLRKLRLR